jgi:hypothetical protein
MEEEVLQIEMCTLTECSISECSLFDFAYLIVLNTHPPQIQICCCKDGHTKFSHCTEAEIDRPLNVGVIEKKCFE